MKTALSLRSPNPHSITSYCDWFGILSILIWLPWAAAGQAAELSIYTEEYPPITFTRDGKVTGLGTEVVEEIQRRAGTPAAIQVVPWARAYQLVQSKSAVALFTTMRTEEREKLFKWVGPLSTVKAGLYAKKSSGLRLASLEEAKKVDGIIVPREWWIHQILRGMGFTNLDAVPNPEQMVRMLIAGRRTLIASDNQTLPLTLTEQGARPEDVELIYTITQTQSYIAFSLATPDALIQRWQKSLNEMKKDGSFARIYGKWLPGEAPPGVDPSPETWPLKR